MAEFFSESGQTEAGSVSSSLAGDFVPGIDKPFFTDGFGLVSPFGGGPTSREYGEYGIQEITSAEDMQLNDLMKGFGGGVTYDFNGLVGPQGLQGLPGRDGVSYLIDLSGMATIPSTAPGILDLNSVLDSVSNWQTSNSIKYSSRSNVYWNLTWENMPVAADTTWSEAALDSDGSVMMISSDLGIYVSVNSGANWSLKEPIAEAFLGVSCSSTGGYGVAISETKAIDGVLWLTSNSGSNWAEVTVQ